MEFIIDIDDIGIDAFHLSSRQISTRIQSIEFESNPDEAKNDDQTVDSKPLTHTRGSVLDRIGQS